MLTFKQPVAPFVGLIQPYLAASKTASCKLALAVFADTVGDRDISTYTAINVLTYVQS